MKNTGSYAISLADSGTHLALVARSTTPAKGEVPGARERPRPFSPKMTAFLAAIQVMPLVKRAAKAAGVHRCSHYRKLQSSPAYATAFREAQKIGYDAILDIALERAVIGWDKPIVYRGRIALRKDPQTGQMVPLTVRKFDNHLLMCILENCHPAYARVPQSKESSSNLEERLNAGRRRVAESRQCKIPA